MVGHRREAAPQGYMQSDYWKLRVSAEQTRKAGNGCCKEMESPSFQKGSPYNEDKGPAYPMGKTAVRS